MYRQWYGDHHPDSGRLGATPYGLPELFREAIVDARWWPIRAAIQPVRSCRWCRCRAELIHSDTVIVDSKSGVSGAGRTPKLTNLYSEVNESFSAYAVGTHRHQPEIVDIVARSSGVSPQVVFTPHLVPMDRGILSTIYVRPRADVTANQVRNCLSEFYQHEPFVRIRSDLPGTKFVAHTNYCDIAVRSNGDWIILLSALDNLIKGAAGAAVQNMNLMFGQPETLGLGA